MRRICHAWAKPKHPELKDSWILLPTRRDQNDIRYPDALCRGDVIFAATNSVYHFLILKTSTWQVTVQDLTKTVSKRVMLNSFQHPFRFKKDPETSSGWRFWQLLNGYKNYMKHLFSALKKTILTCATAHLILLVIYSLSTNDFNVLNLFNIIDIDLFFPYLGEGFFYFIISYIFIGSIYLYYYLRESKKKK